MTTPIRRQYLGIKRRFPHAIVLFRLGDFYETFDADAELCSRELGILLTSRPMGRDLRVPMAGIPHHALEGYLAKLIARGYKVAICEQVGGAIPLRGSPGPGGMGKKGQAGQSLMERQVVRVVTPGTVVEEGLLSERANNYLVALATAEERAGIAYADISTGEFACAQADDSWARGELWRLAPAELLLPQGQEPPEGYRGLLSPLEKSWFDPEMAEEVLREHFECTGLDVIGLSGLPLATAAAGALLCYLKDSQPQALASIVRLGVYSADSFMALDPQTLRNLGVFEGQRSAQEKTKGGSGERSQAGTSREGPEARGGRVGREGSLLERLDLTRTAMGARLLRRWLGQPLLELAALRGRQEAVERFVADAVLRGQAREVLGRVPDLERLLGRVASRAASPRDLLSLGRGLKAATELARFDVRPALPPCPDLADLIAQAIADEPANGEAIRRGFSPDLDELRALTQDAQGYLATLERRERERTGIRSLKVGYNRVFGYYIEVTKPYLDLAPGHYERRQTLVGGERFVTPELKDYELKILHAREAMAEMETKLLRQVSAQVAAQGPQVLALAQAVAQVDAYAALAEAAARYRYVRPELDLGDEIAIEGGRHPMVEGALEEGSFVPNDTHLSTREAQIAIVTGPNMAGKSTYLRQVALIILMAQVGSFVPASSARIGLVDRIFTRAGSQEELVAGRSTFMVEMVETAHILHNATPRSLLIFDEIGRGTSTYDGMAIARAVVEFLHQHPQAAAKTLFATHYHELADLAALLPRVRNYHTAVAEEGDKIVFLHKVLSGAADRSYGVHVAQLAGLPRGVVQRAQEVLAELEAERLQALRPPKRRSQQLPLFPARSPLLDDLAAIDLDSLTPLQALTRLYELRERARRE